MSHIDGNGQPIFPDPPDLGPVLPEPPPVPPDRPGHPTQERLEHHERHTVAELRTGDAFRRDVLQQMYDSCKRQVEDARKNHPGKPMSAMMVQITVEQWVEIPSDYPTNPGETP